MEIKCQPFLSHSFGRRCKTPLNSDSYTSKVMNESDHLILVIQFLYVVGGLFYARLISAPTFLLSELVLAHSMANGRSFYPSNLHGFASSHSAMLGHSAQVAQLHFPREFLSPLIQPRFMEVSIAQCKKAHVLMFLVLGSSPGFTVAL